MLRPFLIAFILLSFAATLAAQEYPNLVSRDRVTTIGYWSLHQRAAYGVTQTSSSYQGKSEKPKRTVTSGYDLRIEVADSTEHSYDFEMVYGNFRFPGEIPIAKNLESLQDGLTIRYRTDELGAFDTILNLPELRQELFAKLREAESLLGGADDEMRGVYSMVVEKMIKSLDSLGSVEALFLEDILMLHGLYGIEMKLAETTPFDIEYFTLGDIGMNGTGTLTLSSITPSKDECRFSSTEKPDRNELKNYFEVLALFFMMGEGKKISTEELNISMSSKKKMKMELSTGWMNEVTVTSTFKLTNKKGERRTVKVVDYKRK
jgi:hypothetical protein